MISILNKIVIINLNSFVIMKTMLNMMKKVNEENALKAAQTLSQAQNQSQMQPKKSAQIVDNQQNSGSNDFASYTTRIQAFLNSGGQALAIAESKTSALVKLNQDNPEYNRLVEEIKAFQARASYDFKQAESLMFTASLLLKKRKS